MQNRNVCGKSKGIKTEIHKKTDGNSSYRREDSGMNSWEDALKDDRYHIEEAIRAVIDLWERTPAVPGAEMFRRVTAREQEANAKRCEVLLATTEKHMKNFPRKVYGQRMWRDRTEKLLFDAMDKDVIFQLGLLAPEVRERLLDAVRTFISHTREFDKTLDIYAMGQALRNYFVYFMLCLASGEENWFHKGVWGYSLLYPYTDNYLDSEKTNEEKRAFNQRLYKRLTGVQVLPEDALEERVFSVLEVMELTYPREQFGGLYELLLIIYDAQVGSLSQQEDVRKEEKELFGRSVYKGGASVYVDQYLIKGCINVKEVRFLTALGLFLQLADDLQDIEEDCQNGHQTYMTLCAGENRMDEAVGRLLGFLSAMFTELWSGVAEMKGFLLENCLQMVLLTVFQNKEYYSAEFLSQLSEWVVLTPEFCGRSAEAGEKLMEDDCGDPMDMLDVWTGKQ